jgi:hypothetical protein
VLASSGITAYAVISGVCAAALRAACRKLLAVLVGGGLFKMMREVS